MLKRLHQFRRWAGVDRAVFFSNGAQVMRLVTGPITMALVLRYLTPEIQGYFYAFSGVVAMQIFLEMGFSQNIMQFTAHEFAKLRLTSAGTLEGDPVALSRLVSLGRLAFGYYAVAALIFFVAVGVGGHIFFAHSGQHGVAWQGAWWMIAVTAAGSLAINPAWALLEGCNRVAIIAQFRFWTTLASFGVNAVALILGAGIYASAIGAVCGLLFSVGYLVIRWRLFLGQFLEHPGQGRVSWRQEIWPLQWRIAVSSMSGYFIFDMVNPIAFYFCGPVEAGRWGMTFQLVRMICNIAWTWVYTKVPRFGVMVANRQWRELDSLLRRSTYQAFIICVLGEVSFLAMIPYIGHFLPRIPARLASTEVAVWLAIAAIIQIPIFAMSAELRSHKRDPYMWLNVFNAALSLTLMLPFTHLWGIRGEAMGYTLAIAVMLILAIPIYRAKRAEYRNAGEMAISPAINNSVF
jgi:O-antigen/teichoic acid export membrane protein